jgi:biopolymer transport protein ExbD
MTWQIRHEGSPKSLQGLTLAQVIEGLRDGQWALTDEVMGPDDTAWVAIENHPQLAEVAAELEMPPRPHDDETRLDMNALIDVCLVLLIFFMLTTTYVTAVQKIVPLPTLSEEQKKRGTKVVRADQVKRQMIRVNATGDKDGKVTIRVENQTLAAMRPDGQTLDADKLREALGPYVNQYGKDQVLLDARGVTWGLVIAIQDAARSAGVRVVNHLVPKKG